MLIEINGISYFINRGMLLDNVNFTINEEDRVAIIGRNGSGKSTLLKIIAGELDRASGEREVKKDASVLLVKQEIPVDQQTPLDYLRNADQQLTDLQNQLAEADGDEIGRLTDEIVRLEEERYEQAAPKILSGLGISATQQQRPLQELAGGLRMRVALASALVIQPDVLLLDEPTNHLDLESVLWLSEYLKTYPRPFIIVSHDPTLLNPLVNKVYHLQGGKLTGYTGNYASFKEQYELRQTQAEDMNSKIDEQQRKDQIFVDKFKVKPKWAGTAKTRERLMAKREEERPELIQEEPPIPIVFPECASLKNPIFSLINTSVGYTDTVLSKLELSIQANSRIGILGRNGQGKSTLVKLITGHLNAKSGEVVATPRLKIGYFSQDQTDILNVNATPYLEVKNVLANATDEMIRKTLSNFGFNRDMVETKVESLSGGEKTRLLMALIACQRPHLIIMDEPTNHLDFVTKDILIGAIKSFNGAVVIVSHDWDLLKQSMQDFWLVADGKVTPYPLGLENYRKHIMTSISSGNKPAPEKGLVKKMQGLTLLVKNEKPKEKPTPEPKHKSHKKKPR